MVRIKQHGSILDRTYTCGKCWTNFSNEDIAEQCCRPKCPDHLDDGENQRLEAFTND